MNEAFIKYKMTEQVLFSEKLINMEFMRLNQISVRVLIIKVNFVDDVMSRCFSLDGDKHLIFIF